jgi:L,D-peptidoglycan transpeptidase YkuD (ErfK/YbiS/YcfS/YnhG family)
LIDLVTLRNQGDGHVARWGSGSGRCAIGRGGAGEKKREGDGITPAGIWPLRRVLYRADRQNAPKTVLPLSPIAANDGWCDAPADKNYNLPVKLPYPASAEELWRADALYDIVVVLGFNDAPVVAGKGSAIFLHVAAKDFAPTEGCVALEKDGLLELLGEISPTAKIHIEAD